LLTGQRLLQDTYYNTVNTRRHRLKQPKFVLRCTQLQVGLPHAIGTVAGHVSVSSMVDHRRHFALALLCSFTRARAQGSETEFNSGKRVRAKKEAHVPLNLDGLVRALRALSAAHCGKTAVRRFGGVFGAWGQRTEGFSGLDLRDHTAPTTSVANDGVGRGTVAAVGLADDDAWSIVIKLCGVCGSC